MSEGGRPNVLLVISDQERQRSWLPASVALPNRQRLLDEGIEFTNFWTHSSPCSPSRATIVTGRYVPQHGVPDNVIHPHHTELDPAIPTAGRLMADAGYRSSYIGKWHLSFGATPPMETYGYGDWDGNDLHFMGWAGTGVWFDPLIASNAAHWLRKNGGSADPWFLTVALVNPHDVMWFPIDQPWYQQAHPDEVGGVRSLLESAAWKDGETLPPFTEPYDEVVEDLPANFGDDLLDKPACHRQWRWDQQHGLWGTIDPDDPAQWRRHLDYYVKLHQMGDENLGLVLDALDQSGAADRTVVLFTSDHGDMCGSHGLRSKGPFLYREITNVPLYVRAPGVTRPGTVTDALASTADLVPTILSLGGASDGLPGVDLTPVLRDPSASVRDHVLFCLDSAHTLNVRNTRYAVRGMFDGRVKYARYYGVGGGKPSEEIKPRPGGKLYDVDARFEDQEHELYDLTDDPHELVNLAMDPSRRTELRGHFARLLELEASEFSV